MIELGKHIEILLLSNDCVIVPDFGGFTASHVSARYDKADNMFLPPSRTLGFNPKLNLNDSLLVQSYSETYGTSYPEAFTRVESEVNELKQQLDNEGSYEINDIGTLYRNDFGVIEFSPCEAGILTPPLYSLGSFDMQKIVSEVTDAKTPAAETVLIPISGTPLSTNKNTEKTATDCLKGKNKRKNIKSGNIIFRNAVAVIITIIVFLALSDNKSTYMGTRTTMSNFDTGIIHNLIGNGYKNIKCDKSINLTGCETSKIVAAEKAETKDKNNVVGNDSFYCIVLASKITDTNAKSFTAKLRKEGFDKTDVLKEEGRALKVVYGYFATKKEAYNALNGNRANGYFNEAWIYKVTNNYEKG